MVAWMAVYAGASAAYLIGDFVYHRWFEKPDIEPREKEEVRIPLTEEGAAFPIFYGKVRVDRPILAWCSTPESEAGSISNGYSTNAWAYRMDMFFIVGCGFEDGTHQLVNMWQGDELFAPGLGGVAPGTDALCELAPRGEFGEAGYIGSRLTWYDGNASQTLTDGAGLPTSLLADRLINTYGWPYTTIPDFRGYVSAFLNNNSGKWFIGTSANVPGYAFEVSSYKDSGDTIVTGSPARIGGDSNPVNVIYDILRRQRGGLGVPVEAIDTASFLACGVTLHQESHGYSRALEEARDGREWISEILHQIDGVLFVREATKQLTLKLIRNDYDPTTIPHITRANAKDIVNFSAGGWANLPNALRCKFTDRSRGYRENSVVAKNPANAVGQDGIVRWVERSFPGCTNVALAERLKWRELTAISRPIMKCRALIDRRFLEVEPGDAVKVTWTEPDISDVIFRVAAVTRGTLSDNVIAADLVQDSFYVYRQVPPLPGGLERPRVDPGLNLGFGL